MIESLLLSPIGAAFGVVLATFLGRILVAILSGGSMPLEFDLSPSWNMLGFTTVIAGATGVILASLRPARDIGCIAIEHAAERRRVARPRTRLLRTSSARKLRSPSSSSPAPASSFARCRTCSSSILDSRPRAYSSSRSTASRRRFLQQLVADVQRMPNVLSAA